MRAAARPRYTRASAPEARARASARRIHSQGHGEGLETLDERKEDAAAARLAVEAAARRTPARDGTQTNLSPVPGAAFPTPSGVRQAPTMQQQTHMAAAAACMHVECVHAAAATAATCKHAALTSLAATHATAHPNGLQAVGGGVATCELLFLKVSPNGNAATGSGKRHELSLHTREGACGK
eukprot:363464-Chlamydomonas_euryale.AAC.3